jgi:hypothetical protein
MKLSHLFLLFLIACNNHPKNSTPLSSDTPQYTIDSFLAKFKSITLDTLKVYSAEDIENDSFKFKGQSLNQHDWPYIKSIYGEFAKEYDSSDVLLSQFYACYKFEVDKHITALIIRTPGEYVSSKIDLFIYNSITQNVYHQIELAENWGDAGDMFERCSFLFKSGNTLNNYQYNYSSYDHSVEDINDSTLEVWRDLYYLKINTKNIDTLNKDSTMLLKYWMKK